jgi:hypothetical protein
VEESNGRGIEYFQTESWNWCCHGTTRLLMYVTTQGQRTSILVEESLEKKVNPTRGQQKTIGEGKEGSFGCS